MRRGQLVGVLMVCAFALALGSATGRGADPELDPADPYGKPANFKAGLSPRMVIFYDKDGWHFWAATNKKGTNFVVNIEAVGGNINYASTDQLLTGQPPKGENKNPQKSTSANFTVDSGQFGNPVLGMLFRFDDKTTAVKLTVKMDKAEDTEHVFLGAKGAHPKTATFYLPAKPEKKKPK